MGETTLPPLANQASIDAKAKELILRADASKRAVADPLPGPLPDAFGPEFIEVHGFKVRQIVVYDWAVLEYLNSPIYRQMLETMQLGDKAENIPATPNDNWDLIYLLTRPCKEARATFKKGIQAFHDAAEEEIGMLPNLALVAQLTFACWQQIKNHMDTMVKYVAPEKEEGDTATQVPFPSPSTSPTTGLDGSSTT